MVPAAEDPDLSPGWSSSDGWFASAYDPSDLMRVFDTLWLKADSPCMPMSFGPAATATASSGRCRPMPRWLVLSS